MQPDGRFEFQLEAELAAAGGVARRRAARHDGAEVDPSFASGLRSQLLTSYAVAAAPAAVAGVSPRRARRGWSRFAPLLAAMLALSLAAVAAAAVYRWLAPPAPASASDNRGGVVPPVASPSPSPSPAPTPYEVPIGLIGGEAWTVSPSPSPSPSPTATPSPSPSATPSPSPTATPSPSPSPTASPTASPTPKPTAAATPKPTAAPTPKPGIGEMAIGLTGCNGGVVIGWSPTGDVRFAKYRTIRSTSPSIPAAYPAKAPATEVETARSGARSASSGYDTLTAGGPFYRVLALDGSGAVIAATGVGSAAAAPVGALGPLQVNPHGPGQTRFKWTPFAGSEACFTYYKLAYTTDGSPPSYLGGDPYLAAISDQGESTFTTADLESGVTYTLRLQAIRVTDTGSFLVAQTSTATYTAP